MPQFPPLLNGDNTSFYLIELWKLKEFVDTKCLQKHLHVLISWCLLQHYCNLLLQTRQLRLRGVGPLVQGHSAESDRAWLATPRHWCPVMIPGRLARIGLDLGEISESIRVTSPGKLRTLLFPPQQTCGLGRLPGPQLLSTWLNTVQLRGNRP